MICILPLFLALYMLHLFFELLSYQNKLTINNRFKAKRTDISRNQFVTDSN